MGHVPQNMKHLPQKVVAHATIVTNMPQNMGYVPQHVGHMPHKVVAHALAQPTSTLSYKRFLVFFDFNTERPLTSLSFYLPVETRFSLFPDQIPADSYQLIR